MLITSGAAESNPTISSIPGSLGSAMVKLLDAIPHTMSRASIPDDYKGEGERERTDNSLLEVSSGVNE